MPSSTIYRQVLTFFFFFNNNNLYGKHELFLMQGSTFITIVLAIHLAVVVAIFLPLSVQIGKS